MDRRVEQVDVAPAEREALADAKAGEDEQPDQARVVELGLGALAELLGCRDEPGNLLGAPDVVLADAAAGRPLVVGEQRERRHGDDPAPDRQLEDGAEWRQVAADPRHGESAPLQVADDPGEPARADLHDVRVKPTGRLELPTPSLRAKSPPAPTGANGHR